MGVRENGYACYGSFELDEVVPFIGKSRHKYRLANSGRVLSVRMGTQRMLLMARQTDCVCCGLKGEYFLLEKSGCLSPHFNLYGVEDGHPVMMTMDHILPRSKGGETVQANLQLLCRRCNAAKKSDLISLDELRERRLNPAGPPPVAPYNDPVESPLQGGNADVSSHDQGPCQARCGQVGRVPEELAHQGRS